MAPEVYYCLLSYESNNFKIGEQKPKGVLAAISKYWPQCAGLSPDINPMENLWGKLSNIIYRNGRVLETLKDLKIAITEKLD